jgi:hypothetical protein
LRIFFLLNRLIPGRRLQIDDIDLCGTSGRPGARSLADALPDAEIPPILIPQELDQRI